MDRGTCHRTMFRFPSPVYNTQHTTFLHIGATDLALRALTAIRAAHITRLAQ